MDQYELHDKKITSLKTRRIRQLNDAFRKSFSRDYGQVLLTAGVQALPDPERVAVLSKVMSFADFDEGNDPYSEHDFGGFEHLGRGYFFKIDYYDSTLTVASRDPSNLKQTVRVLTIMLAEEY